MPDPFEARERSFYVAGEMTEFDVAAVQDYLGKLGLRVMEKPLPIVSAPLQSDMELPEALRSEVIVKDDFMEHRRGSGTGRVWSRVVRDARDNRLPLVLRRTDDNQIGVTYRSVEETLALVDSKGYKDRGLSCSAKLLLTKIAEERRQAEIATTAEQ